MLEIKDLKVSYDDKPVLNDVNLTIGEQEIVALIGPSGTGKSTLINSITALHPITSGKIELNNQPISTKQMNISWIPQNYGLLPWLSVKENILLGLSIKKQPTIGNKEQEILRIIKELGLELLLKQFPNQLSGGQQQRVAIAKAMVMDSDVYLLDEPFSALDAITREKMQQLFLSEWYQKPAPTILITHDVEEAVFLGQRIILLSGKPGQIVEEISNPSFSISSDEKRVSDSFYQVAKQVREVLNQNKEKK